MTVGKYFTSTTAELRLLPRRDRGATYDTIFAECSYDYRVKMMPVVSAIGDTGPLLFGCKGKKLSYRRVDRGGGQKTVSVSNVLPTRPLFASRNLLGAVDSRNYLEWAWKFVDHVTYLTTNGEKFRLF